MDVAEARAVDAAVAAAPSAIVVQAGFGRTWPLVAEHLERLWRAQGPLQVVRLETGDTRSVWQALANPAGVRRLVTLGVALTVDDLEHLPALREVALTPRPDEALAAALEQRGVRSYRHVAEGYWAQSVAEYGLALTLCGLRRIPQLHHEIITSQAPWDYSPSGGGRKYLHRGQQFGDDDRFTNGTIAGKRVRVVGAGNIASRYASFCHTLGADVAAWDPYATEPSFHRAGSRREWHLDCLVRDAEIFAPMVPLRESTRGLVTAAHVDALPRGCLVVLVTRARVCDVEAIRRRVLADEIALAADVFDVEPLPLDDPLLGRHNVVHSPHNAGRTRHANRQWAEQLAEQFLPLG
jgi:phosphoglycerate dehydrogenase-like enzyme